jgi:hypothetical protein
MLSTAALGPLAALFSAPGASAQLGLRTLRDFDFAPYRLPADAESPEASAEADARLIELCDQMVEARAEFLDLYCGKGSPSDPDNHPVIGPRLKTLDAIEDTIVPQLRGMRAQSLACAEAMARVALLFAERDIDWQVPEEGRGWPGMAAIEWLAGDDFCHWAATHPQHRTQTPPPPLRRAGA